MKSRKPEFNAAVDRSFSRFRVAIMSMGMVVLIMALLLIGALQEISERNGTSVAAGDSYAEARSLEEDDMVNLLVAKETVSAGVQLTNANFAVRPVKRIHAPADAYFESDLQFVAGKYSKREIKADFPISGDDISDIRVVNELDIPEGYRAVTIMVNSRTSVEGFAKPNTHVDVLWFHTDERGMKKVATIIRAAKILAFGGMTDSEAVAANEGENVNLSSTATLLVKEREAQMVELAANLGTLSLSLVGSEELQRRRSAEQLHGTPRIQSVSVKDIYRLGLGEEELSEQDRDGLMKVRDPRNGRLMTYELTNGKWKEVTDKPSEVKQVEDDLTRELARASLHSSGNWNPTGITVPVE